MILKSSWLAAVRQGLGGWEILLQRRKDPVDLLGEELGWWTLPGGAPERDTDGNVTETARETAFRESQEEFSYDFTECPIILGREVPSAKFAGQFYGLFVVEFPMHLDPEFAICREECSGWSWVPLNEVLVNGLVAEERIIPFQLNTFIRLLAEECKLLDLVPA